MVSMALTISVGVEASLLSRTASSSAASASGCGGCWGLIASPPLSSVTLPKRVGRRKKKCLVDRASDAAAASGVRRGHCRAELKSMTMEVYDDSLELKSGFGPPLGWPFSAMAAPDLDLLGKKSKDREEAPESPSDFDGRHEKGIALNVLDDNEVNPSETLYRHWIATEFSAAVQSGSPPPRQKQENSERDNYYVNTGYAIRTLREDLPHLFYKKLNFDIYRDDITFRDPRNAFSGIDNYKLICWALRFHGRIFFKSIWVDIGRVWQPHDKVIMVRWTVKGIPRVPWEAQGQFEGTSEYKLDKDGKIYEHIVDNVVMNTPKTQKFKAISVMDLVRVAGGQTNPTPSFYAQAAGLCVMFSAMFPYLQQFTWVRFYWALTSTLALNNAGECRHELGLNT